MCCCITSSAALRHIAQRAIDHETTRREGCLVATNHTGEIIAHNVIAPEFLDLNHDETVGTPIHNRLNSSSFSHLLAKMKIPHYIPSDRAMLPSGWTRYQVILFLSTDAPRARGASIIIAKMKRIEHACRSIFLFQLRNHLKPMNSSDERLPSIDLDYAVSFGNAVPAGAGAPPAVHPTDLPIIEGELAASGDETHTRLSSGHSCPPIEPKQSVSHFPFPTGVPHSSEDSGTTSEIAPE